MSRVTAKMIRTAVAKCEFRNTRDGDGLAGIPCVMAQAETVRGEPRLNYVQCMRYSGVFHECRCAMPEGSCPSARAAEIRATVVRAARNGM